MTEYFLTGTYSEPILFGTGELFKGKGEGLYLCALEDGDIRILDCLKLGNPSFLAINEEKKHIYAVNEMKEFKGVYGGGLTDIVYDDTGRMTVVDSFPTGGWDPCHVAVSPDGGVVCVANYADGKAGVCAQRTQHSSDASGGTACTQYPVFAGWQTVRDGSGD